MPCYEAKNHTVQHKLTAGVVIGAHRLFSVPNELMIDRQLMLRNRAVAGVNRWSTRFTQCPGGFAEW